MAYQCPPRDAFTVGWICALPIEAAAATEILDDYYGILEEQDAADPNTYTLGRIGKHYVVIACIGGHYGTASATRVAINMLRTFKSVRVGLLVGIGGGIPSATHDIRLGDIVISYPQGTSCGVIQYDMGKIASDGQFERNGSLNGPPRALLTAISMMRAAGLREDPRYLEFIRTAIERNNRTRKSFSRPPTQSDRLFQADYDHSRLAGTRGCDTCLVQCEVARNEREESDPQCHYGIIASGDKVIKHGRTRDKIRSETGALCFEMEAAGLMTDFPCLVIRGVCDYADSHKNKQWQGYAALTAAAYAKELLGYVPVRHDPQEKLVVNLGACDGFEDGFQFTNRHLDQAYHQREQLEPHREKVGRFLTGQHHYCRNALRTSTDERQKNTNESRRSLLIDSAEREVHPWILVSGSESNRTDDL